MLEILGHGNLEYGFNMFMNLHKEFKEKFNERGWITVKSKANIYSCFAILRSAHPAHRFMNPKTVCNLASQSSAAHILPTGLRILRPYATWLRNPPRRTSCPHAYDFIRMDESWDRVQPGFAILRGVRLAKFSAIWNIISGPHNSTSGRSKISDVTDVVLIDKSHRVQLRSKFFSSTAAL